MTLRTLGTNVTALNNAIAAQRPVDIAAEPGVDATGATDCSTALQTAINRANSIGAPKFFRAGTYKFSGVVDAPGNNKDISWIGQGDTTILKPASGSGATMLTIDGGTSNRQRQKVSGFQVDLSGLNAQFLLTKGFGGRGELSDLTIHNPSATLTNAIIRLGDGVTAPNDIVAAHVKNVKVKGASTTNGIAVQFGNRVDSVTFEGFHALNIGTGVANDTATSSGGTDLRFYGGCIFEQCTTGIALLDVGLAGLSIRDSRFEACSTVAADFRGLDSTNNLVFDINVENVYVSGMGVGSIGFRFQRTKGVEVNGVHFRALNGLGSYPAAAVPFAWTSPNYRVRLRRITTDPVSSVLGDMSGYSNLFNRNDPYAGELYSFDSQVLMGGVQGVRVLDSGPVSDTSFTLPNGTAQSIVNGGLAMTADLGDLWLKYGTKTSTSGTWVPLGGDRYRKLITGRYYGGNAGSLTTNAGTLNYLFFVPLWVPHAVTIDRLGFEVTTAAASAVARLGIYSADSSDLPSTLVTEFTTGATVDCSTTGVKESTISQALTAGLYYMALGMQGAAFTFRACTGRIPPAAATTFAGVTAGAVTNHLYLTGQTGAMPASVTGSSTIGGALAPRMQVRVA